MKKLIEIPGAEKGMIKSMEKNVKDTEMFLRPLLNEAGFGVHHCRGRQRLDMHKLSDHKIWSQTNKRLDPISGSGLYLFIYPQGDSTNHKLFSHFHRPSVTSLKNYPHWNIPTNFCPELRVDEMKEELIKQALPYLNHLDLYFIVSTKTNWFYWGKYGDLSPDDCSVTYRNKKTKKLNRLVVKESIVKKVQSRTEFIKTFNKIY